MARGRFRTAVRLAVHIAVGFISVDMTARTRHGSAIAAVAAARRSWGRTEPKQQGFTRRDRQPAFDEACGEFTVSRPDGCRRTYGPQVSAAVRFGVKLRWKQ